MTKELSAEKIHDNAAHKIAQDGQTWAKKVLRKDDMVIYIFRLALEYARGVRRGARAHGLCARLVREIAL